MSVERLRFGEDPVVATAVTDTHLDTAVVEAVATASNARLEDIPPLFDVVDCDALGSLFTQDRTGVVAFDFCGFLVCVHAEGRITVYDRD